jgi:hypothetical protein
MAKATSNSDGGLKRPKVKVSQKTIDDIKKLGMTKALKLAGMNKGAEQSGLVGEFAEGVRRMYGERRYQAAIYKPGSAAPAAPSAPNKNPYGFSGMPGKAGKTGTGAKTVQKTKKLSDNPLAKFVSSRVGGTSGPKPKSK